MTQQQQEEKVQHPSRADRQKCWKVRDAFFACLDQSNVVDPSSPEAANICQDLRKNYHDACMKSWVEYFNKRRVLEVEQKEMLERMRAQHKAAEDRAAETAKAKTPKAA
ncbi:cytochrome oxidase c subunit VIb-domain-containing protein [Lobosporangium transversale]|uniref:Cytochrome oxidase c subunit VIb-domain-containing protein n=1 Tax=Lobosporangium transversale TaxID=64571 RepID=A0A1Y2GD18_9FUNG|nr:cytochrome oxidase c subunit VIb-domain-containing protein [Lobosporangium transversale]ORZ07486.1 cytochrome oxidase c subunit VIb-domain-containing protein [Lobosporangium transversale]|eukprot:XP_021877993.1 cytochrome oxidase c subunit VIb-domain-containing protein [Lobosporangium transversale]